MKKILLFSPPFSGHLNVLKALIKRLQHTYELHLVITGWKNIKPDLSSITIPVTILAESNLHTTDPEIWTLPRLVELLDKSFTLTKKINPDLIVYDFFSLEGNVVGKKLGIPYWCSVSAFIGPYENQSYLAQKLSMSENKKALKNLEKKHGVVLKPTDFEMISDGFHLPGKLNIVWSYPKLLPTNFKKNRHTARYVCIGNIRGSELPTLHKFKPLKNTYPLIYISLGTVVMENLWNKQPKIRKKLKLFFNTLARLWKNKPYDIALVSQGKKIFKSLPENWVVVDRADQVKILSQADIFITHGGSNSFHEAVLKHIPMIGIPFFGDQPLVASQIEKLRLGKNLVANNEIDTKKSKNFLNTTLAKKTAQAVNVILKNKKRYQERFKKLTYHAQDIEQLLKSHLK